MLALHHLRSTQRPRSTALGPAPRSAGFSSPSEHARFASGMASKGSTPEGIAWFLDGDR